MSPPHTMTLVQLIDKASQTRGTTATRKLARIAQEAGYQLSHTTLAQIRAGTYPSAPSDATLAALAFLAGVPERLARQAAGLPVSGVPFAKQLPQNVDLLRVDQRDAVLKVIRLLVEAEERATAGDESGAPIEDTGLHGRRVLRDENDPLLHRNGTDEERERK